MIRLVSILPHAFLPALHSSPFHSILLVTHSVTSNRPHSFRSLTTLPVLAPLMALPMISAAQAARMLTSNSRVFVHSVAAAPKLLVEAMAARSNELKNVEVVHLH